MANMIEVALSEESSGAEEKAKRGTRVYEYKEATGVRTENGLKLTRILHTKKDEEDRSPSAYRMRLDVPFEDLDKKEGRDRDRRRSRSRRRDRERRREKDDHERPREKKRDRPDRPEAERDRVRDRERRREERQAVEGVKNVHAETKPERKERDREDKRENKEPERDDKREIKEREREDKREIKERDRAQTHIDRVKEREKEREKAPRKKGKEHEHGNHVEEKPVRREEKQVRNEKAPEREKQTLVVDHREQRPRSDHRDPRIVVRRSVSSSSSSSSSSTTYERQAQPQKADELRRRLIMVKHNHQVEADERLWYLFPKHIYFGHAEWEHSYAKYPSKGDIFDR